MLLYLAIGIASLLVVLIVVIALQPAAFKIERSTTVNAAPIVVFDHVNDFRAWAAWSPWDKIDASLKRTYSGPPAGAGAHYAWEGNKKVGRGMMTITDATPPQQIRIRLEFLKPFKATNLTVFTFTPQGNQTLVNWAMTGERNFIMKAFGLMMNMDKLVGGDFERGLATLKVVSEAAAKQ